MDLTQQHQARHLLDEPGENEGPSAKELGICREDMVQLLYRFPVSRKFLRHEEIHVRCDTHLKERDQIEPIELFSYHNREGVAVAREIMTVETISPYGEKSYARFAVKLYFPVLD